MQQFFQPLDSHGKDKVIKQQHQHDQPPEPEGVGEILKPSGPDKIMQQENIHGILSKNGQHIPKNRDARKEKPRKQNHRQRSDAVCDIGVGFSEF